MSPSKTFSLLAALILANLTGGQLRGQGYESKFKAIGFKPGDVYHTDENVNVSLTGGGLEVKFPLGPALPGPIPLQPVAYYHGKYSQVLNENWYYLLADDELGKGGVLQQTDPDAYRKSYKRWLPPNLAFAEAHPGNLLFRVGALGGSPIETDIVLNSPFGKTTNFVLSSVGAYLYSSSNPADAAEINGLIQNFAPASEWDRTAKSAPSTCAGQAGTPTYESVGTTLGIRVSGGTVLVFGPSNDVIYSVWDQSYSPVNSRLLKVPHEILEVGPEFITLWRRSRNVYSHQWNPKDVGGTLARYEWSQSVFHPVWMKTRSGFRADFTIYRNPASGRNSCLSDAGLLTGYKVSINNGATWFQVGLPPGIVSGSTVTFGGMDVTSASGAGFWGQTPPRADLLTAYWQPGTKTGYETYTTDGTWELEYSSATLGFTAQNFTYGGLTTAFEWAGPQGQLSKLTMPSGKTYAFTYQVYQGVGTKPASLNSPPGWNWTSVTPTALDFYSMVGGMDVLENVGGGAQTRSTTYQWRFPKPDPASPVGTVNWSSTTQGVAQALPSGESILHVFSPPMSAPTGTDPLELAGRTYLASRLAVAARYRYPAGDSSWQSFITSGTDPSTSSWYARERFEGFDLRSVEGQIPAPKGNVPIYLSSNTEPRPTRTLKEERDGPVEVTEQDGWDPQAGNYSVRRTYILAPWGSPTPQFWAPGSLEGISGSSNTYLAGAGLGETTPSGAQAHQVTAITFQSDASAGLRDREQKTETKVLLAPPTGASGFVARSQQTFDTGLRGHVVTQRDQLDLDGGTSALSLAFDQRPLGLFAVNQLQGVTLSSNPAGAPLSGQVGATYGYDPTGRFMTTLQQKGVAWREEEPDHDSMGRTLSHLDPNGYSTRYTWDTLGRLTGLTPPLPETSTVITPDNSLRKTTLTRGSQVLVYYTNGFGELIGEERSGPKGGVSHKSYGFDTAGRKTFETVWQGGAFTNSTEWAMAKPGGGGVATWAYDGRGRVVRTVSANGEATDTTYPSPFQTVVTAYPSVDGVPTTATTTFDKDVLGRQVRVTDAAGQATNYAYDAGGRIRQVQQGTQLRTWIYDLFGRLQSLAQPESGTTRYASYTVTGKPTYTIYGDGSFAPKTLTTSFDALSRPLTVQSADGSVDQAFAYDGALAGGRSAFGSAMGRLTYARDKGVELWYTFNGLNGRLGALDTRVGDGGVTTAAGQLFSQTFGYADDGLRNSTSVDGRSQVLNLDPASRLPLGVVHTTAGTSRTVASLDPDPTSWATTRIDYGNGASTTMAYRPDQLGLQNMAHRLAGAAVDRNVWTYSYDGAGRLSGDGQDVYRYDILGRLKQAVVTRPGSTQVLTQGFTYDAWGNQLSSTTTANVGLLPSTVAASNFAFAPTASELASRNQLPAAQTGAQYDTQGNLTYVWKNAAGTGYLQMAYDALGRVLSVSDSDSGLRETYAYTPEGLRARVDVYRGTLLQKSLFKVYDDQRRMVSEYQGGTVGSLAAGTVPSQAAAPVAPAVQPPQTKRPGTRAPMKQALVLGGDVRIPAAPSGKGQGPKVTLKIKYRKNSGNPTIINSVGACGAYITSPIGPLNLQQGATVSFIGQTDFGTDFTWDFGDGTPSVTGKSEVLTTSHTFSTLSGNGPFTVMFTARNVMGGYTLSTDSLSVSVQPPTLPAINSFTANGVPGSVGVQWGDGATLAWNVSGTGVSLSLSQQPPGGVATSLGAVTGSSYTLTNLQQTTDYILTASNAAGPVTKTVRIYVLPRISSFLASATPIAPGGTSTLSWSVAYAASVTLQEGATPAWTVTGTTSRTVSPTQPTTYTLAATNGDGTTSAPLQVNVTPVISSFSAFPATINPGQSTTLSWTTAGSGLTLTLDPGALTVTGTTSAVVSPLVATTYTLTARNSYASTAAYAGVALNGPPSIQTQPGNVSVVAGQVASFSVAASGSGTLAYQWYRGGVAIIGATGASYSLVTTLADQGATFYVVVSNAAGTVQSATATLSVVADTVAPTVTAAESGVSGAITLSATATDNVGVTRVEFSVDGVTKGTVTAPPWSMSLDSTTLANGSHTLIARAYDAAGNMGTSAGVAFSLSNPTPTAPAILTQPANRTVTAGQTASFSVGAGGTGPLAYQWYRIPPGGATGAAIAGANGASYATPATTLADSGSQFYAVVSNAYGSAQSQSASLTVTPAGQSGLTWKRDIVYVGSKEMGEIDASGLHVTQVDHLGSPRLLSGPTGALEDEQKYMPFGEYLDGLKLSRKGYTGHEQTDPSGLIYMQARFYAPMYHRFLSPDPARDQHFEETQSWNIYSYVRNIPTMHIDPTGMVVGDESDKEAEKRKQAEYQKQQTAQPEKSRTERAIDWFLGLFGFGDAAKANQERRAALQDMARDDYDDSSARARRNAAAASPNAEGTAINQAGLSATRSALENTYMLGVGAVASRAISLPGWSKVTVDMEHIAERHMAGGALTAGRDVFVGLSERGVMAAVRQAYGSARTVAVQGERVLLSGTTRTGMNVEMWLNRTTRVIETAYPVVR